MNIKLITDLCKNRKEEDIAHPQTQLTPHQIADVRRTWEGVRGQRNAIVSEIFVKY